MDFFLFTDQLLIDIEQLFSLFFVADFWLNLIFQIFVTKMNCGLLGDQHKRSHYHRIQIEIVHFSSGKFEWTFSKCGTLARDMQKLCSHFESSPSRMSKFSAASFLARSRKTPTLVVSTAVNVRSFLHLLATLENLTLRHFESNTQRLVSQHIVLRDSNLVDWVL